MFKTEKKTAILVVSFGTSYEEARKRTLDRIEQEIRSRYPACQVCRAWSSETLRRQVLRRDGLEIPDLAGAMEQLLAKGVQAVAVQPTYVFNGGENARLIAEASAFKGRFAQLVIGPPLLSRQDDLERIARLLAKEFQPGAHEALVLMGHGTEGRSPAMYAALGAQFRQMGYPQIFLGVMKDAQAFAALLKAVRTQHPLKVWLAPLMIVAGKHAADELAGDGEDSWKKRFQKEGYVVECIMKGLGEYPGVREMFLEHVAQSLQQLETQD